MFPTAKSDARRWPFAASLALHVAAAVVVLWPPLAAFVHPSQMAEGNQGLSAQLIRLASAPPERIVFPRSAQQYLSAAPRLHQPADANHRHRARSRELRVQPVKNAEASAGSLLGNVAEGLEHDLRPALPLVFPDPAVSRADLPPGVTGDVIVEVTIDVHGRITATRLLAGMGYGVAQKVLAALETWRFTPATQDGVPIASRQDVHFHFPG